MLFFGVCFFLYFIKLFSTNGFLNDTLIGCRNIVEN